MRQNLFVRKSSDEKQTIQGLLFSSDLSKYNQLVKRVNRKVQAEPQAEAAANPRHQEEEKKRHTLTCAQQTNKCTIRTKTSSLFPKQGDQNAKRTEETHRQRAGQDQTRSAPQCKPHQLHRIRTTSGPPP